MVQMLDKLISKWYTYIRKKRKRGNTYVKIKERRFRKKAC